MPSGTGEVCPDCAEAMQPRTGGYCTKCGEMFGCNTDTPTICAACRLAPPQWDTLHFHGRYDGVLRDMILSYKFNNGLGRTRLLSNMAVAALQRSDFRTPDLIVPVPLHTKRLQWRGFNQSTELARALGRALDRPVPKPRSPAFGTPRRRHASVSRTGNPTSKRVCRRPGQGQRQSDTHGG